MSKVTKEWSGAIVLLLLLHGAVMSQQRVVITDNDFRIPELSVILSEEEEVVSVRFAMPTEGRIKPYRHVDIKQGDIILYLNGKRIKAVAAFRKLYEDLKTGDAVQMGVKRGNDRFIAAFDKADPDDLPQMAVSGSPPGEGGARTMRMSLGPEAMGATPVLGLGALIRDEDNGPEIVAKLPSPGDNLEFPDLQTGDVIKKLNGKSIESTAQLVEVFDAIAAGTEITLELLRADKPMQLEFSKSDVQGNIMIRTQ